jgi:hypothetical protein
MNKNKNKTKTRKNKRAKAKRKTFRGGMTVPFSDLSHLFSDFTHSIGSAFSTFSIMPSGYNPPHTPDISKQFLNPNAPLSINQMNKNPF